jgi:hypothetical protein
MLKKFGNYWFFFKSIMVLIGMIKAWIGVQHNNNCYVVFIKTLLPWFLETEHRSKVIQPICGRAWFQPSILLLVFCLLRILRSCHWTVCLPSKGIKKWERNEKKSLYWHKPPVLSSWENTIQMSQMGTSQTELVQARKWEKPKSQMMERCLSV